MIRRLQTIVIGLGLVLALASGLSAQVSVSASVNRNQIAEGETIQFTIIVKGSVSRLPEIALPNLDGFQVYSSGTSQNYSWVNGQTEQSKQFNFVLAPTRSGKLNIPSMALDVDGKRYVTQGIQVTVIAGSGSQNATNDPNRGRPRARQGQSRQVSNEDIFIRTSVDRDTVYVNQQVTLSFKFFQGVDILQNPDYKPPQKTGFWVEDLPPQKKGYETVKGRDFAVTEIKNGLFPTAPGTQSVGSAQLSVVVNDRQSNDPFSMFGNSMSSFFGQGRTLNLTSDPIKVVALPLPTAGKPADFNGAVGQFQLSATADKTRLEVNEPVTMHIKISGVGNIKTIAIPTIRDLPDFRTYQAGDSENVEKVNYKVGGSKSFQQVFIPRRAGTYLLPALSFSFFDPDARSYKTATTQPIQIEVSPSKDRFASQVQNLQTNRIDLTAKDIRYLKSELGPIRPSRRAPLAASPYFLSLYLLPLVGYLVVLSRQRHKEKLATDTGFRRLRQARKMAESRLAKAKKYLGDSDPDAFYAETSRSLIDYFADRYNLPAFGLTADKIKEFASGKQSDVLIGQFLQLLQQCDFGRFAPGGSGKSQMERLWDEARQLIVELEKTR
jgi:hypothetical protein